MPEEHSLFSASGASGWMQCHGKIAMERGRRTSSQYADEGTAAHTLAQDVLEARIKGIRSSAQDHLGRKITVKNPGTERTFTVTKDMAEYVDDFVDSFMAATEGNKVVRYSEMRVHYHEALGTLKGEAFGTSDAGAAVGRTLVIDDLKYGMGVRVDAQDNEQLRLYALGLLYELELIGEFDDVRMIIHQPRLEHWSEETITVAELRAWAKLAAAEVPKVKAALALAGSHKQPDVAAQLELAGYLNPSEKACKFCDGKPFCPALAREVTNVVSGGVATAADFDDLTVDTPAEVHKYGDNWLAISASKLALIDLWQKSVRAEIDRRVLLEGKTVEGFKVVAGKKGDRKFKDEEAAEKLLLGAGLTGPAIYSIKLKTPTQLEKALKAQPVWLKVAPLIGQADGKPAVVTLDDKRPAIAHTALADDFDDLDAAEGVTASGNAHPFR